MNKIELKKRTKEFAISIIKLVGNLPNNTIARTIGHQIIRSGTSVAANYRAACRSRSKAEFISKINIVEEESDETLFWLEILLESHIVKNEQVYRLIIEADELTAIFTSTGKSAKQNRDR